MRVRRAASRSIASRFELVRPDQLEIVAVVGPGGLHADAGQHLEDPVDLLDLGDAAEDRTAAVQQAGAEQGDGGVLGGADRDAAVELGAALDPQVLRPGARRRR